ncbi:hypothetical protein GCK72_012820 [Caenorhabditis remanei]|uniref:Uncharacterized protein n=1 Tax=Caenorhabditis remanei TaxID=31234 RepID=A0A6A5GM57_CAERE|nr:hypothetical protein GCK72_012820 [Caenorhabditis remanei]KAF1756367.1 hypothetical protein GCK72_012820 [Caenorhabditis remanei]
MAITFESIIEFAFILAVLSACAVLFRRLGERAVINKPPPPPNRRHRRQNDSREGDEANPRRGRNQRQNVPPHRRHAR